MAEEEPTDWIPVDGQVGLWARYRRDRTGRLIVCGLKIEANAITADALHGIPLSRIEAIANGAGGEVDNLPALVRAPGMDPAAFSAIVAAHWRCHAARSPHPGAYMAEIAGVPVPTVHSWIREARLRGLLPAARRRKGD